jgi:hypothetical protein
MSGRQLAKLVLAFQSAVFGSGTTRLTQAEWGCWDGAWNNGGIIGDVYTIQKKSNM